MTLKRLFASILFTLTFVLLSACGGDNNKTDSAKSTQKQPVSKTEKPAVGALITDLTGLGSSAEEEKAKSKEGYRELDWKELAPDDGSEDKILAKYQPQIDKIPEGGPGAKPLYDKMLAEFNALPANPKLDGQKIKIPGYVTVLEQKKGFVKEFLLVPYFGACIHVPPPPLNNTLLIRLKEDQRLNIEDVYSPVWVKGIIHTETIKTDLASAGYLIENAEVELFDNEE